MKRRGIDLIANEQDGLDDYYLKGEPDYLGRIYGVLLLIFLVIYFWPQKG